MLELRAPRALQQFVDDELMRAPLLVDQVVDGAVEHMRQGLRDMTPHDRAVAGDLMHKVQSHRQHIADYYVESLRGQVDAGPHRAGPLPAAAEPKLSLSLVDEDEVAVDVAISHAIEAIRSVAEYELRELQTFISALVGDMDVTQDHNPFRPETHARALWAAAQALPMSRGYQLVFMRHASMALAQVLRKAFAGASSRLESAGIQPAAHRTVILPGLTRRRVGVETTFSPDLGRIRDTMPVRDGAASAREPLDQVLAQAAAQFESLPAGADEAEQRRVQEAQRKRLVESAPNPADQQAIELLSRLFDALLSERTLVPDIRQLLARLQAPALRIALREPKALDKVAHPFWQFVDRVAFFGEILPTTGGAERERVLRQTLQLIEQLAAEPNQTTALYQWALDSLLINEEQRLERRCAAAARTITQLQQLEDKLTVSHTTPSTMHGALDLAQLDTVPAELIDTDADPRKPAAESAAWLARLRPGAWVRMFMQGRWVHAQLLWPGERAELFLFAHGASDTTWGVRRNALLTLFGERLLDSLEPRSLVRDAAKRVMRQMAR